jgi:hypothetical protein
LSNYVSFFTVYISLHSLQNILGTGVKPRIQIAEKQSVIDSNKATKQQSNKATKQRCERERAKRTLKACDHDAMIMKVAKGKVETFWNRLMSYT